MSNLVLPLVDKLLAAARAGRDPETDVGSLCIMLAEDLEDRWLRKMPKETLAIFDLCLVLDPRLKHHRLQLWDDDDRRWTALRSVLPALPLPDPLRSPPQRHHIPIWCKPRFPSHS